jgi:16S rRNA processing protein RimM
VAGLDVLNAGRVGRPHGLDGSFHVTRPRPALLALGGEVRIGDVVWEIVRRAGTDDRPILRLHGVDDRAGAEALRGEDLFVARSLAPPLEEGEYWAEDLRGCRVVTAGDRELGVVDELRALPSCEVLEVGEMLVPMVGDAVIAVDVAARRIVVDARFLGLDEAGEPGGLSAAPEAPPAAPDAPAAAPAAPPAAPDAPPAAPDAPPAAPDAPAAAPDTWSAARDARSAAPDALPAAPAAPWAPAVPAAPDAPPPPAAPDAPPAPAAPDAARG